MPCFTGRQVGIADAWLGTIAFAGQIFCDFAGYSTCALGAALCLGFSMPDNFRAPYAALGFSDFWLRWHISLSSWLRDYLYIPLGGNRRGPTRTYVNLVLTMLIGGLWHGASWTFVAWGALHGAYLIGERVIMRVLPQGAWRSTRWARALGMVVTLVLVCVAWVFFRASSFGEAFQIVRALVGINTGLRVFPLFDYRLVSLCFGTLIIVQWITRDLTIEQAVERTPWPIRAVALGLMLTALLLMQGQDRAFIYFQF